MKHKETHFSIKTKFLHFANLIFINPFLAFFYISKLPIRFNKDFTALQISQSSLQWGLVRKSFSHLLLHGLLSRSLALYHGILRRSERDFGWERLVGLALVFFVFTGGFVWIFLFKDTKSLN